MRPDVEMSNARLTNASEEESDGEHRTRRDCFFLESRRQKNHILPTCSHMFSLPPLTAFPPSVPFLSTHLRRLNTRAARYAVVQRVMGACHTVSGQVR